MTTTQISGGDVDELELTSPETPPRENLFRAMPAIELLRDDDDSDSDDDSMPTLAGHFAVFNSWTEIDSIFEGRFLERFSPGAFAKTISESRERMRVLFNHGRDPSIGDKVLGPISELGEDKRGAYYEVPMLDTEYNRELIPGLDAGLYGASFRFRVVKEEWLDKPRRSKRNPDGLPERTITEAQVREFGPVTFPAYPDASAGLRSLTDEFVFGRLAEEPERLRELIEFYGQLSERPDVNRSATDDDSEPEPSGATTRDNETHEPTTPSGDVTVRDFLKPGKEKPAWLL